MRIVHHPSSAGNTAALRAAEDDSALEPARLSHHHYRSAVRRWLDSPEARVFSRAARDVARELVSRANYDDDSAGRLRAWVGYSGFESVSRATVYRETKALCGEDASVRGMMTRRPARDGETIVRDGVVIWTFTAKPNQQLPYLYTFDPPARFTVPDRRKKREAAPAAPSQPAAGFQGRIVPAGPAESDGEPVQGVLPPAPLVATSTGTRIALDESRALFAQFSQLYPKPYRMNSEGWDAWREIVTTVAIAHEINTAIRARLELGGEWADLEAFDHKPGDRWRIPKAASFLRGGQWRAAEAPQAVLVPPAMNAPLLAPAVRAERGQGFTSARAIALSDTFGLVPAVADSQAAADARKAANLAAAELDRQALEARELARLEMEEMQREREQLRGEWAGLMDARRDVDRLLSANALSVDRTTFELPPDRAAERVDLMAQRDRIVATMDTCRKALRALGADVPR